MLFLRCGLCGPIEAGFLGGAACKCDTHKALDFPTFWFGTKNLLRNSRKDSRNYGPNPCGNFERSISTLEFQRNAALRWFRASDGLTGARSSGDELWRERWDSNPRPPA